jgi:hypothetical protein
MIDGDGITEAAFDDRYAPARSYASGMVRLWLGRVNANLKEGDGRIGCTAVERPS